MTKAQKRLVALLLRHAAENNAREKKFVRARAAIVIARLREQGVPNPVAVFNKPHNFKCTACGHRVHFDAQTGEAEQCHYDSCGRGCCDACECKTLRVARS